MSGTSHMDHSSPGGGHAASSLTSKLVGPGHAETVHASEKFDKAGLLAAHHAALHDAYMLERGLLPGTSLPNSEAPPIPPVYAESPWKDFKLLSLTDMKVGKTHRRQALQGRLCAKSLKVTSVVNVLEADSGFATKLILTNALPARASMAQAQHCYPEGSRVTVRDPYLTRFPDGVVGVLVERPNDIAFLSRPESTGDNGHLIYGAVGYEDERASLGSRDHEDFSRKVHLFEQQMKQEHQAQLDSLESRRMSGMFQRPVSHHWGEDHAHASPKAQAKEPQSPVKKAQSLVDEVRSPVKDVRSPVKEVRSSPVKEVRSPVDEIRSPVKAVRSIVKEVRSPVKEVRSPVKDVRSPVKEVRSPVKEVRSPVKEKPKAVIAEEPVASQTAVVDRIHDSPVVKSPEPTPGPSLVAVVQEGPLLEITANDAPANESVEEPTTPKAEERRGVKDVGTPEEDSLKAPPPDALPKSLELEKEAPRHDAGTDEPEVSEQREVTEHPEIAEQPEVAEHPEVSAAVEEATESSPEQAANEPITIAEASVSGKEGGDSEGQQQQQLGTLENGETKVLEIQKPVVRKKFHRSDSLLAVQDVEDSNARALGASAAGAASRDQSSAAAEAVEPIIPESRNNAKVEKDVPLKAKKIPPTVDSLETHTANDFRVLGNQMFGEENFAGAANMYTRSIILAEAEEKRQGKLVRSSEIILGYSNRAEAYIRLQEFGKALADAKKALSRDPSHLKSLFRKGRALLGLSQYEQALTTLQAAAPRAPTDKDLQAALHESSTGVEQSCHGHYDLAHYYLKGKPSGECPLSADYVGPVVVTDVGRGRGRGLVLTKDVEAGELVLVSNPMAFLALQDVDHARRDVSQAFVDGKVQEGFRHVFETAHHKGLEKLQTLCDGEKSLPAPSVHQTDDEADTHELHLDHARVRRIIQLNAINGDATMGWKNLPGSGEQDKKVEHWGLWWLPSFLNHSCLPSSSPILVGKALFVFAARDLRAGEEVTRAYFDIFQPLAQRKELSTKGWGFVCHCPRCKLEDALHSSLSKVTEQYTKLMELASKSKAEFGTDEHLTETQTSAALKFFHKLESKLKDFKLNGAENNWVRASFLHYIDMISGDHELHTHLESIVEALVAVCPGSETTLHMAVVAKDSARRTFGKKSTQFKAGNHRALTVCRFTYGKQKASVLQAIVDRNDYQS